MPMFEKYPDETSANFTQRMKKQTKQGGMVRAANRFLQTSDQKKKEKPITSQY